MNPAITDRHNALRAIANGSAQVQQNSDGIRVTFATGAHVSVTRTFSYCTCNDFARSHECAHSAAARIEYNQRLNPTDNDDGSLNDPLSWIDEDNETVAPHPIQRSFYLVRPGHAGNGVDVEVYSATGRALRLSGWEQPVSPDGHSIGTIERGMLGMLFAHASPRSDRGHVAELRGAPGRRVLEALFASMKTINSDTMPLSFEKPANVQYSWVPDQEGAQRFTLSEGQSIVYLDGALLFDGQSLRPVTSSLNGRLLTKLANSPAIPAELSEEAYRRLEAISVHNEGLPRKINVRHEIATPTPRITLHAVPSAWLSDGSDRNDPIAPAAFLEVDYEKPLGRRFENGEVVVRTSDDKAERSFRRAFKKAGGKALKLNGSRAEKDAFTFAPEMGRAGIYHFLRDHVPTFEREGSVSSTAEYRQHRPEFVHVDGINDIGINGKFFDSTFDVSLSGSVAGDVGLTVDLIVPMIRLVAQIPDDASDDEARELIEQLSHKQEFIEKLPDGRYAVIPVDQVKEQLLLTWRLLTSLTVEGDRVVLNRYDLGTIALLGRDCGLTMPAQIRALVEAYRESETLEVPVPKLFAQKPDKIQMEGLRWMLTLRRAGFGGILSDEVGVGKTAQAILLLCHLYEHGELDDGGLVIVPKTAIGNWIGEFKKFAPDLPVQSWETSPEFCSCDENGAADAQILLTTYPVLLNARRDNITHSRKRAIVFFDEAQDINNVSAGVTNAAARLEAAQKIPLSATPVENSLDEIWTLMNLANPGLMGEMKDFRRDIRRKIEDDSDLSAQKRLAAFLRPFLMRRTRKQAGHSIPDPEMLLHPVELSDAEKRLYETIRLSSRSVVREAIETSGFKRAQITVLAEIMRLRQACSHPALVTGGLGVDIAKAGHHSKLDAIVKIARSAQKKGRKFLVFSQWTGHLAIIRLALEAHGIRCGLIQGDVQGPERTRNVDAFQGGELDTLLISMKTGGRALNLPAAHEVIIADLWWNPQVEIQAIGRTQRRGQRKKVVVHRFYVPNSVEEHTLEMQDRKRGLASCIFGEFSEDVRNLNAEDIERIFAPI